VSPRPDGARSTVACFSVRGTAVRLEARRRALEEWRTHMEEESGTGGDPLSVVLLDATGAVDEPALRAAMPWHEVRRFTLPPIAEEPGAVRRAFVKTSSLTRRNLLTHDGKLSDRGEAALSRGSCDTLAAASEPKGKA
jgi:hypothetical protein